MSKVIWNPTKEELAGQYAGVSYFLQPDEKRKVEDNCGKHLLNQLGQRGLSDLEYRSDEGKIKADALARNKSFKLRMIVEFNQRNEARKQMNLGFIPPSKEIDGYAQELGIELLKPYNVNVGDHDKLQRLEQENNVLKTQLADLMKMVQGLASAKTETKPDTNSFPSRRTEGK